MKLKEEARAHGGCRASERKIVISLEFEVLTVVVMKSTIFWVGSVCMQFESNDILE
jgi:hypothetical protein